jgi:hypothetical protein
VLPEVLFKKRLAEADFDLDDPVLPRSFRRRRSVAAAFNPLRGTTILFGGFVGVTRSALTRRRKSRRSATTLASPRLHGAG